MGNSVMKPLMIAFGAAMMFGAPALAQTATTVTTPTPQSATPAAATAPTTVAKALPANDVNRVVCRTEDVLGSRLKKQKTCMTLGQWRDVSRQSGDWLEKRTSMKGSMGGG